MRRLIVALAVAVILLMAVSIPASASRGSWFNVRINPSTFNWTQTPPLFGDLPYSGTANMFGATGFLQIPNSRFGLRGNIDTGSLTSWSPLTVYDSGRWRWYDISLAMPVNFGQVMTLLFAGYGNTFWQASSGASPLTEQDTSGWAFGADVWMPIGHSGRWYVTGNATFGPGQRWRYCNAFPCNDTLVASGGNARALGTANAWVYAAGLGWNPPTGMTSVELGWRSGGFDVASVTSGDVSTAGQHLTWSGVYLGLTVRK